MTFEQNIAEMQIFSATVGRLGPKWVETGSQIDQNWVKRGSHVGPVGHLCHVEGSVHHVGPMGHVGHWASKFL